MHKNEHQATLAEGHSKFLVSALLQGNPQSITQWVEEKLVREGSNLSQISKNAFYEAEKSLLKKYIAENKFNKLVTLTNAIDNKKFDNNQKLKINVCRVLANAIIEAKRYLEEEKSMHKDLHTLLYTKYKELADKEYRGKISDQITEALSIVQYTDAESLEVSTMGEMGSML